MMNTKLKIKKLWEYLRIQDNEVLIVQVYNMMKDTDEYLIAEKRDNNISIHYMNGFLDHVSGRPFRFIQYRNLKGYYIIPSVKKLQKDRQMDY